MGEARSLAIEPAESVPPIMATCAASADKRKLSLLSLAFGCCCCYARFSFRGEGISAAQAVSYAADAMNISGFSPQSLGEAKILATFGNLKPAYNDGEKFSGGGVFADDISVEKVVFPLGAEGRLAYKFVLTTPQYYGVMWQTIVDAQTGDILQRLSLTCHVRTKPSRLGWRRDRPSVPSSLSIAS